MTRSTSTKKTSTRKNPPKTRSATSAAATGALRSLATGTAAAAVTAPAPVSPAPEPAGLGPVLAPQTAAEPAEDREGNSAGPEMKKQELLQKVVERSGIRKRDAKPVVEAMLAVLGNALAEGRELDLQPLGKIMTTRSNEKANARILFTRIRQSKKRPSTPKDTVAADPE